MTLFFWVILKKKGGHADDWCHGGYMPRKGHPLRRGLLVLPKLRTSTLRQLANDLLDRGTK